MQERLTLFLKSYGFSCLLILSILIGALLGIIYGQDVLRLKPLGDIFLNLLFTVIVPLVFFSISSAVASMSNFKRLGRIMSVMILIFAATGLVASCLMISVVILFPLTAGTTIAIANNTGIHQINAVDQIVRAFTVADFPLLLSKHNMLALIIFSILTGMATSACKDQGKAFAAFLASANEVMQKLVTFISCSLCAYFACLVATFGPQLLNSYGQAMLLYYPTALATGSSMAAIPANLQAADNVGVPRDISEVIIPIGATIHMEGSCLAAVLKIAFLFGVFQIPFAGAEQILTALGIALLTGVVVSGIPGGGTIGELLILSLYGFPPEAFALITMIGTLVDAPATMLNSTDDNVSSMMVARVLEGREWMEKHGTPG